MIQLLKLLLMLSVEFKYEFSSSSNYHGALLTENQGIFRSFFNRPDC